MLERIISGGQSGADQSGLRAAKKLGISNRRPGREGLDDRGRPGAASDALVRATRVLPTRLPPRTKANARRRRDGDIRRGFLGVAAHGQGWNADGAPEIPPESKEYSDAPPRVPQGSLEDPETR